MLILKNANFKISNVTQNHNLDAVVFDVAFTDTEWDNFAIRTGYHAPSDKTAPMLVSKVKGLKIKPDHQSDFPLHNIIIWSSMWDAPEDTEIEFEDFANLVLYPNPDDLSDSISARIKVRMSTILRAETIAEHIIPAMYAKRNQSESTESARDLYDNITTARRKHVEINEHNTQR